MIHKFRRPLFVMAIPLFIILAIWSLTIGFSRAAAEPVLVVVSFTAEWCPNCTILDPALEQAMEEMDEDEVEHIILDMTNAETRRESFEEVNGTVFAEVYGDHLGVTGIGILTAADSGEKIGCVTRRYNSADIAELINEATLIVKTQGPYARRSGLGDCPRSNNKVPL